jgi:hypothetical protein
MANQDQNLVYAWNAQKLGATAGQSGYAQPDLAAPTAGALAANAQVSAGAPFPAPAGITDVLTNPGYATGNGTVLGVITAPTVPATTVAIQNPSGNTALVTIAANGATISAVNVAPNTASGAGTFVQVAAGAGQVTVPPGGWIKMSYTVATPTWTWTTIN